MIYARINSAKMRCKRILLSCILIITTLITFSSCTTTESSYVTIGSYDQGSQAKILKIILKNGIEINCQDKLVRFEDIYDQGGAIIISFGDTLKSGAINWKEQRIPETNIYKIFIEEDKVNATKTILIVSGVVLVAALIFIVLAGIGFGEIMHNGFNKMLRGLSFK